MASSEKNLSQYEDKEIPSGKDLHIGIVVAKYNEDITSALFEGCRQTLIDHEVETANISVLTVPGSYELPQGARILLSKHRSLDAIICLGCVIKGETSHNEYINYAVANALMQIGLSSGKPCIFGVLTPNDKQQAEDRAGGKHGNKGVEAAVTALKMAYLTNKEGLPSHKIGFGI